MEARSNQPTTGTGATPYVAVVDLAPDPSVDHVAHVDGLRKFPDKESPRNVDGVVHKEVTVIYTGLPPERWCVKVTETEDQWKAIRSGCRKADV